MLGQTEGNSDYFGKSRMTKLSSLDWSEASNEARRHLYLAVKNRVDNGRTTWNKFLHAAFGKAPELTEDFTKRLQRGKLARSYYAKMAEQFESDFPDEAERLVPELQTLLIIYPQEKTYDGWEQFVEANAAFSNIEVLKVNQNGLNIVGFASTEPLADLRLKLGDRFCFRVDSPIEGQVFALQRLNHAWYKLPLSRQGQLVIPIKQGQQIIPTNLSNGESCQCASVGTDHRGYHGSDQGRGPSHRQPSYPARD